MARAGPRAQRFRRATSRPTPRCQRSPQRRKLRVYRLRAAQKPKPVEGPTPPTREHGQLPERVPGHSQGHAASPRPEAPVPMVPMDRAARGPCLPLDRDRCQVLSYRRRRRRRWERRPWIRSVPLPAALRSWRHYRVRGSSVPQAWRRLPLHTFTGLGFNRHGNSFMMRSQWNTRHCRHTQSPVNIRTGLPESLGSFYTCPPSQESPDPCAEETVPRALSRCENGKRRLDGPLSFETPGPKRRRQSPEPRPSAFRPVWRHGVVSAFVPRPGPLRRSFCSRHNSLREEDTEPRPDQQACRSLPCLPPTLL
ncbi:hypothetical protein J1605_015770 [Eschrichtius robustus]|uniref:POM121-like protein 12 n=1 Tax=Eschrichtius robustus TaxID=9764 RepID=A0AB34G8R1_ESCRO|nr:hypothetical protein J1605_015770 [Eschrichtius robustus]